MSEPKRYELYVDASLQAEEGGEWVKYDDYADLKDEVERLTKAGDAMASALKDGGIIISGYALADEWLKAKLLAAKEVQS